MIPFGFDAIPLAFHGDLFPAPGASVSELLVFMLPPQEQVVSNILKSFPSGFVSVDPPITMNMSSLRQIQSLPIPSQPNIDALQRFLSDPKANVRNAIYYAHLPNGHSARSIPFPHWVVAYWWLIAQLRHYALVPWLQAESWISQVHPSIRASDLCTSVDKIYSNLHNLPWTGKMHAFCDSEPIIHFSRYLSSEWLGMTHIHQQLDLLRHRLSHGSHPFAFEILPNHFFQKIINIYNHQSEQYTANHRPTHHIWSVGEQLTDPAFRHSKLGGILNIDANHWITVVIDIAQSTIFCGDSLGTGHDCIPPAIDWWVNIHVGQHFTHLPLPIGQQGDGISCSLFAVNALAHFSSLNMHFCPRGMSMQSIFAGSMKPLALSWIL